MNNFLNIFDSFQSLTKQEPELKNQVEVQKEKVKKSAPNQKRVKELETRVVSTEKGMAY